MKPKFSGARQAILCACFLFGCQGVLASWIIPYGVYFPAYFGTEDIVPLSFGAGTVATGIAVIIGLGFASNMIAKLGPRRVLIIDALCILGQMLLWAFIPNLVSYYLGWVLVGMDIGTAYPAATQVIINWYYHKRQKIIGLVVGSANFGMFVFQFLAGQIFPAFGVSKGYLIQAVIAMLFMLVPMIFLKEKPEMVGQKALGWEDDPELNAIAIESDESNKDVAEMERRKFDKLIWTLPSFIVLLIAYFIIGNGPSVLSSYMTIMLPEYGGMDVATASTVMSLTSLGVALILMFIIGPAVDKFGPKKVLVTCSISSVVCIALILPYCSTQGSMGILVLISLTYCLGFCMPNLTNFISPAIYGTVLATPANAKLGAAAHGCSMYGIPVSSMILAWGGMPAMGVIFAILLFVGLALVLLALALVKKDKAKIDRIVQEA